MYLTTKEHQTSAKKLFNLIEKGNIELLGISYKVSDIDFKYLPEPYIDNVKSDGTNLEFENRIYAHERDKVSLGIADRVLTESGLGYVRVENMDGGVTQSNLITDLMLQGTNQSGIKKVTVGSTFIEPTVTYQKTTMAKDVKLTLYKIQEQSVLTNTKFTVYLLTSEKMYDGQSLLGMLSRKDKLSKRETEQVLNFIITTKQNNPIINKELPGAYLETEDLSFNIYNTNKTGIYFLPSEDNQSFSVASGQSFVNIKKSSILNSKVVNLGRDNYELEIKLKGNKELTIFF